jgi:HSP20 family protein
MLVRTDPFHDLDRLTRQIFGNGARSNIMPMDAYRKGGDYWIQFNVPGARPEDIEVTAERNMLTVKAQTKPTVEGEDLEWVAAERPTGSFTRQVMLSDALDTDHMQAGYDAGVLTVRIPVREQAKPRKIQITSQNQPAAISA